MRFLRWFCNPAFLEEIEGDLYEIFYLKTTGRGHNYAKNTFILDVLKFFRWSNFKKPVVMKNSINNGLWAHNFKITLRVFKRNLMFTGINISGLILGISAFVILLLYYLQENSYDKFFTDSDRIYRVSINSMSDGQYVESAKGPIPFIDVLKQGLSHQEALSRFITFTAYLQFEDNDKMKETQFVFADEEAMSIFDFKITQGSIEGSFNAPFQLVISESKATQYFGDKNPIGATLKFEEEYGQHEFTVIAVMEDLPKNTHFHIDFLAPFNTLDKTMPWHVNWHYPSTYLYTKLKSKEQATEATALAQKLMDENAQQGYDKNEPKVVLQELEGIHLNSDRQGEWKSNNTQISPNFFLALGAFILLIAVINYINLTTANSLQRSKEIGLKKAMGSEKGQLIKQFIVESLIMICIAILVSSLLLLVLWNPLISKLLNPEVITNYLFTFQTLAFVIFGALVLAILAGIYPAFTTTRFNPIDVIKNNLSGYLSKGLQRRVLVTIQFSISMCMILFTILLIKQYYFLQSKNVGYDKDYHISLRMIDDHDKRNYATLKEELLRLPYIENVAVSNTVIGLGVDFHGFPVTLPDRPDLGQFEWYTLGVGEDYLQTFNIKLLEGRDFSDEIQSDERQAFILNEAAIRELDWEGQAVGKDMELTVYTNGPDIRKGKIIGVVEDFNYQSLYESVKPLVIFINKHRYYTDFLNVKVASSGSLVDQVKGIEEVYTDFNPNKPMEMMFIKNEIEQTYRRELSSSRMITIFTLLSIFIAALGVFGLATYTFRRRAKEIGVRKVLGASANHITLVLVKEYIYMILISCLISWPLVYFFSTNWLNNFAYAIDFGGFNYLLGLALVALITLSSSFYQIMQSLRVNPAEHLRDE